MSNNIAKTMRKSSFWLFLLGSAGWAVAIGYVVFLYFPYVLALSLWTAASIGLFFLSFKYEKDEPEK